MVGDQQVERRAGDVRRHDQQCLVAGTDGGFEQGQRLFGFLERFVEQRDAGCGEHGAFAFRL